MIIFNREYRMGNHSIKVPAWAYTSVFVVDITPLAIASGVIILKNN